MGTMASPQSRCYEFGPYRIDTRERLLHRGEEVVSLPPKVIATLLALLENPGRMVDKGDLMKTVWPDVYVEEGALARNVSLLRKTFGDVGQEPVYIETFHRRGYRFVAPVRTAALETDSPAAGETLSATPADAVQLQPSPEGMRRNRLVLAGALLLVLAGVAALTVYLFRSRPGSLSAPVRTPRTTLAVFSFRSLETGPGQDYFAEGMTQALVTALAKLGSLRVISLASESALREKPAALSKVLRDQSVNRILTGTVLRSGQRVRIDAQLIDPGTRAVYWANYYERDMTDVLTLEAAVAEAIAGEIQVTITAEEKRSLRTNRTVNPEALDAYLRGRHFWNRRTEDGLRRAVQYFQQAIALDPAYALAYSGLADSYALLGSIGVDGMPPVKAMPLAKTAAQRALELEPNLADAHTSLAYVKLSYDWDLQAAEKEFSRALALNPNSATAHHWFSHYYMAAGDLSKAAEQMREALRLEPLSPGINIGIGWCHYYARRYDEAIGQYRSVVDLEPRLPLAHQTLGMAYQQKGMFSEAIDEFQQAVALSGGSPGPVAALASAYAAAGKIADARKELARLEEMSRTRYVPAFYLASIYYSMGDVAKAFQLGWKAVGERCDYLMYLRVEPRAGKLAANPEFIRLVAALHR